MNSSRYIPIGTVAIVVCMFIVATTVTLSPTSGSVVVESRPGGELGCPIPVDLQLTDDDSDSHTSPTAGDCTDAQTGLRASITAGSAFFVYYEVDDQGVETQVATGSCSVGGNNCAGGFQGTIDEDSKLKVVGHSSMDGWAISRTDLGL